MKIYVRLIISILLGALCLYIGYVAMKYFIPSDILPVTNVAIGTVIFFLLLPKKKGD